MESADGRTKQPYYHITYNYRDDKKVRPRLRDRASWPPMAAGASSRNLGEAFLAVSVQLSHKKKEREKERT